MTLAEALRAAGGELSRRRVEDAALEAEIMLGYMLGLSRSQLYVEFEREIKADEQNRLNGLIERRAKGEPTAYITGHREFYGLDFYVDKRVLIPRPESELLVDKAIELGREGRLLFADIGTGSGCIAVSLAVNLPQAKIYATDISAEALQVARSNCRKHAVEDKITLLQGDLAEPLLERVEVIIANLPYVRRSEMAAVNTHAYEPALALDGGEDGLDRIRVLVRQAEGKVKAKGQILLEIGQGQAEATIESLKIQFPRASLQVLPDLAGIQRVVIAELPATA